MGIQQFFYQLVNIFSIVAVCDHILRDRKIMVGHTGFVSLKPLFCIGVYPVRSADIEDPL